MAKAAPPLVAPNGRPCGIDTHAMSASRLSSARCPLGRSLPCQETVPARLTFHPSRASPMERQAGSQGTQASDAAATSPEDRGHSKFVERVSDWLPASRSDDKNDPLKRSNTGVKSLADCAFKSLAIERMHTTPIKLNTLMHVPPICSYFVSFAEADIVCFAIHLARRI